MEVDLGAVKRSDSCLGNRSSHSTRDQGGQYLFVSGYLEVSKIFVLKIFFSIFLNNFFLIKNNVNYNLFNYIF